MIVAILSIALAATFMFNIPAVINQIDITRLAMGGLIFFTAFTMVLPHLGKAKFLMKIVILAELIASQYISFTYFILPAFGLEGQQPLGSLNDWIAIILLIHAAIHLVILYLNRQERSLIGFMLYAALLAGSAYLIEKPYFDLNHNYYIAAGFAVHATLASYYMIFKAKDKKEDKKKLKDKKENEDD